jgi:hypothetical protein
LSYFSSKLSRLTPPTIDVLVPIDVVGGFSETRLQLDCGHRPSVAATMILWRLRPRNFLGSPICAAGQQSDCKSSNV